MSFIKSQWRVTHDPDGTPTVLLDYGDLMFAELIMDQDRNNQIQPFLGADWPSLWDRGNVNANVTFSSVKEYATPAEAATQQITHALQLAALRDAPLRIEIEGGGTFNFAQSVINKPTPSMGIDLKDSRRVGWTFDMQVSEPT